MGAKEEEPTGGDKSVSRSTVWFRAAFAGIRGLVLLLGTFTLLNVLTELRYPGFDANLWWIDLRLANRTVYNSMMIAAGSGWIVFAIRPSWPRFPGKVFCGLLAALMVIAAWNVWTFYRLVFSAEIRAGFPIPLSGGIFVLLGLIVWAVIVRNRVPPSKSFDHAISLLALGIGIVLFPVAQMHCYGMTDYRRPADLIVVFGCRVFPDDVPSMALSDRVKTGVELFQAGLGRKLVFSGGPGEGKLHETEVMRRIAMDLGVPESAIETDRQGLNTQATVRNLVAQYSGMKQPRVLAVSHFFHLPRIKLCFRRAGWDVWTVPSEESARMYYNERNILREVAAWWWYYLNPD